ncbi:CoA synthetase [Microbaculum sp. A6E488]|uniref:CoA synthetase n=2 Tax=Microbaculum marinisediminis TaxID=2931392 RepID=A0AAW5QZ54_9HYPH|nr:CoA synthetase [Microbaculum sp. A6E488]
MIAAIARKLQGCGHIAVGVLSPIPGSAALLTRARAGARVSIIGSTHPDFRTDGGVDLFDSAGQGRIDAFFLSGGQIDGQANVNLTGIGAYPELDVRWSGAFGSAYLYFMVPRVILFRAEHSRRVFVPKVDFISAPGVSPANVHRPGGPHALVTNLCVMRFDRAAGRFTLESVHPGHTLEEVRDNTGFDFDAAADLAQTPLPHRETLALIRGTVARDIAGPYPEFARAVLGHAA